MRNWDERDETGVCRASQDFADVQRVCERLAMPCQQVDFIKEYWNDVFSTFLDQYKSGHTPNPDILCNQKIKFTTFYNHVMTSLKATAIATGHYAQLHRSNTGVVKLLQSKDTFKDQSYFLCQVPQVSLQNTLFPIGHLTKPQVRELACDAGLEFLTHKKEEEGEDDVEDGVLAPKKRLVTIKTVEKWVAENDKELDTSLWLKYEKDGRDTVGLLKCAVCVEFEARLVGMRNFRSTFIEGTPNLRTTSFKDHAKSDMHARAMMLFKKKQAGPSNASSCPPIIQLIQNLDAETEARVKRKFDIAFFICKENLSFLKMGSLCELQTRHGVDLGEGYKNNKACTEFAHYIAEDQLSILKKVLADAKFISIQADGSTDSGNSENELFLVVSFEANSNDRKVHVRSRFLAVQEIKRANAEGLFQCFKNAMSHVGISDWETKVIGFGCDGTNANIAAGGLRGHLEESMPWIVVFWCLSHRLELALKDALKNTYFSTVDDMLLKLYFLYEKSPKKCREIEDIVAELKACLEPSEMPRSRGIKPLRACGTRFIAHKLAALERVVNRLGAYLNHLAILSEDPSMKSTDRQKMKGYLQQWHNAKVLYGCALFHDLLKPAAILCVALQNDEVSIIGAIEAFLKTKKAMEKVRDMAFEDLPTVKKVIGAIQQSDDGGVSYQGAQLTNFDGCITSLKKTKDQCVQAIEACLKDRLKVQCPDLLTHALTILAPMGWERKDDASFGYSAIDAISIRFRTPLEHAKVDCSVLQQEWDDMVDYAKRYLNLVQEDYSVLWWKLFNAVDAKKWSNILALVELLFCLPMSNGKVERMFSVLKNIKTEKRTRLSEDNLDDLMRISVDAPEMSAWDASGAVKLWWSAKTRRTVKDTRKTPESAAAEVEIIDGNEEEDALVLDGHHLFTIGQRARIGGHPVAWFVVGKDPVRNTVIVAEGTSHPALFCHSFVTEKPHWIGGVSPEVISRGNTLTCTVRYRHQQTLVRCDVAQQQTGHLLVQCRDPLRAVTPGQAAVVCCLALVTCMNVSKLYNTFVGTGRDGSLQQLSSLLHSSGQQRSIPFEAGLTCDGSSSGQQGQLTAPDAAMHSVRHLVHTSELHVNSSGCERTLEHSAHFSFSKINRLFTLAKGGLGSCNKAGGEAIF
eukprot:Em0001g3766a